MAKPNQLTSARGARVVARAEQNYDSVEDPRDDRGKRYPLPGMLNLLVAAAASAKASFRSVEDFSADLNPVVRRKLGLNGSPSDTAAYELAANLNPDGFRQTLWGQIRNDLNRKAITNDLIPGGVTSLDGKGKGSGIGKAPNPTVRQSTFDDHGSPCWDAFGLEAVLVSSSARPLLDLEFIDGKSGEATTFPKILTRLVRGPFPNLFQYVVTDSGMASASNAQLTLDLGKTYVFQIKENFNRLFPLAQSLLAQAPVMTQTDERAQGLAVRRELRRVTVPDDIKFPGACQFWGVHETRTNNQGVVVHEEHRVYLTSTPWEELSPKLILKMIRLHWGIENNCNWTLDVVFREDTQCPCKAGNGVLVMSWIRALAYNLVAVFRAHLPAKDKLPEEWKRVQELVYQAMLGIRRTAATVDGEEDLAQAA